MTYDNIEMINERIQTIHSEMDGYGKMLVFMPSLREAYEEELAILQSVVEKLQEEERQNELRKAHEQAEKSKKEAEKYKKQLKHQENTIHTMDNKHNKEARDWSEKIIIHENEYKKEKKKQEEELKLKLETITAEANRLERERIAAEAREVKRIEHEQLKKKLKVEKERVLAEKEAALKAEKERVLTEKEAALKAEKERVLAEKEAVQDVERSPEQAIVTIIPNEAEVVPFNEVYPTTGSALKAWRLKNGFSDTQAADYLGVSRATIYQSEKNTGSLGPKLMDSFRRKYGISVHQEKTSTILEDKPEFQILLGATQHSPQYGIIGETAEKRVAIDLNNNHVISLFGVQGGGKSYNLGNLVELATTPIPKLNCLPQPFATIIFHYSATLDYAPEFTSMAEPNSNTEQLRLLKERYGAEPQALSDLLLLVPADKLQERQAEYPNLDVRPLKFSSSELKIAHWQFLMGTVENSSIYMQQVTRLMRQQRSELTLKTFQEAIQASPLAKSLKELACQRLDLASDFIDDTTRIRPLLCPGRLLIVDLRDELMEKDRALGLFVVLLQIFAEATYNGENFNKLVVFDEAHKYTKNTELVAELVEYVREMRHKGTSILVASQDPPSVPASLIELSTQIILHKFNSPSWLKHLQKANSALSSVTPEQMSNLQVGEAYIWSSKATDDAFTKGVQKVVCRPRVSQHGGASRTATQGKHEADC